jgi:hypothetical protein
MKPIISIKCLGHGNCDNLVRDRRGCGDRCEQQGPIKLCLVRSLPYLPNLVSDNLGTAYREEGKSANGRPLRHIFNSRLSPTCRRRTKTMSILRGVDHAAGASLSVLPQRTDT